MEKDLEVSSTTTLLDFPFLCICVRARLFTGEMHMKRGLQQESTCDLCEGSEDVLHTIRDCLIAKEC